ncbi:MAG: CheR family methyltransferase [Pseudomonas sp.]
MSHTTESAAPPPTHRNILNHLNFPVVGIGAAEGGLQALRHFFERMPDTNGMAFVIILHLSPRLESSVYRILQRVTGMPVVQVIRPVPIEKNHLYIISPSLNLSMNDGHLRVSRAVPTQGRSMAIDLFFQTLADAHRHWAYGIVLTGTGSDGALGVARIKAQGGLTLAQSPDDAEYAEMPRNAIATGKVDQILPLAEMPRWLLRSRSGQEVKQHSRATPVRRFEWRMQINDPTEPPTCQEVFLGNAAHTQPLPADRRLDVARFFRHPQAFAALAREVLAQLYADDAYQGREIRVWSAGCSTGEEPYSLAMLLCEQARRSEHPGTFQVFATDIDKQAIAIGRAGLYPHAIVSDVAPQRLEQFFNKDQAHYRIKKEFRQKVLFAVHNLLRDPPFCKLDLLCCRNLLKHLNPEVQRELLQMFHFSLAPGGYLFLGCTDSADGCAELFTPVDKKNRLYRAKTPSNLQRNRSTSPPHAPWPSVTSQPFG